MKKIFQRFIVFAIVIAIFSNICVTPTSAAHTHKGVMCGDKITWYEQKDGTNHVKVVAYENLCSCGAVLGTIDEVRTTEKHSFSGETCTKCYYTKTHTHVGAMCGDRVTWYDNITADTHTYYTAYENLCSCGAYLGLVDQTSTKQNHSWNGDTCSKCGYTRAHTHKAVMCGNQVSWYDNITADSHTYYFGYEDLCSCGKNMGVTLSYSYESEHSWDEDTCYECGYTRPHEHKGVMCGQYQNWYEWNETTHTWYGAYEDVCSCGKVLGWTDMSSSTSPHYFDDDVCIDCGYKREHVHEGVMCGDKITTLKSFDEYTHTYVTAFENLCSCGEYLGLIDETAETANHSFDDDVCISCGYQRAHVHQGVACGQKLSWYENPTVEGHIFVTANEDVCSCGEVIGTCDRVETFETHSFDGDTCTKCNHTRKVTESDHQHVATKIANNGFTFYSYVNEKIHHKVLYEGDHICSCGEVVKIGEYTTYEEPHNIREGKCTRCDASVHEHKPSKKAETGKYYLYNDEKQHMVVQIASGSYCECGEFIPENNESVTYNYEEHKFSDHKCTKCGYNNKSYGQVALEQSILGDFSDDVNMTGLAGQIIVGEIPFVGFVADVRDLMASENIVDVGINLVGFIPFVGSLKYSDEVYTVVKHTDDIAGLIDNSDEIYKAAQAVMKHGDEVYSVGKAVEISRVADNFDEGFDSYKAFKKKYGSAGSGYEWHHIVEQSQIGKSGFDTRMIQNAGNIIPLDIDTHHKVSGYYSRLVPGTNMRFRDWIAHKGFTYEQQQKIGEYVLEIYGVKVR